MKSRVLTLLLAGAILLSTGCSNVNEDGAKSQSDDTGASSNASEASMEEENEFEEHVTLKWYVRGSEPANAQSVLDEFNTRVTEAMNTSVEIIWEPSGTFNDKMNMINQSAEPHDLQWVGWWAQGYEVSAIRGAYLALDDMLELVPDLKNSISENVWELMKVDGKIYGVPNMQLLFKQDGYKFKADIVDKYDIDLTQIKTLDDITEIFEEIAPKEPDMYMNIGFPDTIHTVEDGLSLVDSRVAWWRVNPYTMEMYPEDYQKQAKIEQNAVARDWFEKGYSPTDIATLTSTEYVTGNYFAREETYIGIDKVYEAQGDFYSYVVPICEPTLPRQGPRGTMQSISHTSKNLKEPLNS